MKNTLIRPTSTLSQPGSIISEGDIRRRGKIMILPFFFNEKFLFLVMTPSSSTEFLGRPAWFTERLRLVWDFYPTPEKFEPVN